jgi:cytochrome P450
VDIAKHCDHLDPHDPAFAEDGSLDAVVGWLREHRPVAHTDAHGGAYVVTRYDGVWEVARDWQTFTSTQGIFIPRAANAASQIPGECDPPLHREYRRALNPLLTRQVVEGCDPGMRVVARQLLDNLRGLAEADLVPAFTDPYPRLIFFRYFLGVPDSEIDQVVGYTVAIGRPKSLEAASTAWTEFSDYLSMICERRAAEPSRDDLLNGILHAEVGGRPLNRDEAVRALLHLTFGGLGTTTAAIANIIRRLAENAPLQLRLRSDRTAIPHAIEELMRFDTVATVVARTATRDVEMSGTVIPEGAKVLMYFAGANHDPREFDRPDDIDIDRNVNRHLVFGAGPHRCVGSNLARKQIIVALEEVLDHLDDIRLVEDCQLRFRPGFTRGLNTLPVTFTYRG